MQTLIWTNIIFGALIFALLLIANKKDDEKDDRHIIYAFMSLFITALIFSNIIMLNLPQAIDVYRGQTKLEITSVNNEPVDTIVVWKNN